jgi:hypothetical protein
MRFIKEFTLRTPSPCFLDEHFFSFPILIPSTIVCPYSVQVCVSIALHCCPVALFATVQETIGSRLVPVELVYRQRKSARGAVFFCYHARILEPF